MKRIIAEIEDERFHQKIKVKAAGQGKTIKEVIIQLLIEWLKSEK